MPDSAVISPLRPECAISGRKLESLDGLRAIAILLVVLHHANYLIPWANRFMSMARLYLGIGWLGVDLFFVLSGFLITGILLDTREASNYFSGFYARRALRIFPLYYVALTGLILMGEILTRVQAPGADWVASMLPLPADRWVYFCYLTNWVGLWKQPWGPSMSAHFWSLAVEEQFYLVWPLIVWIARPRATRWIAIVLAIAAAIIRCIWVSHSGPSTAVGLATVTRMDSLFCGVLCASLYRDRNAMLKIRRWLPWIGWLCIGAFVNVLTLIIWFPQRMATLIYGNLPPSGTYADTLWVVAEKGGFSVLAVGFAAIVLSCAFSDGAPTWTQKVLRSRLLGTIGKYSYGMYVFHVPILGLINIYVASRLQATEQYGAGTCVALITALVVITFLVAALSYELFERKILSYKRYFEPAYVTSTELVDEEAVEPASV